MKTKKRVLPALIFSLFAATAAGSASAQQFSQTVVFGDSLSDAGYFRPVLTALENTLNDADWSNESVSSLKRSKDWTV